MSAAGKSHTITAPMQAVVHTVHVAVGDSVSAGQEVAVLEAMKMQHGVASPTAGKVTAVKLKVGDVAEEGQAFITVEAGAAAAAETATQAEETDPDHIRADLAELQRSWLAHRTPTGRRRSPSGTASATARRAKMSMICAMRAALSNTAR